MADNEGMYVANRNVTVNTDYGYTIVFKKDEPVYVPPMAREDAVAQGVLPVNGVMPMHEEPEPKVEPIGPARNRAILEAVKVIVDRNSNDEFTAGGVPKEAVVQKEAGFRVHRREINAAFIELTAKNKG
jgi:hypothetical protein